MLARPQHSIRSTDIQAVVRVDSYNSLSAAAIGTVIDYEYKGRKLILGAESPFFSAPHMQPSVLDNANDAI